MKKKEDPHKRTFSVTSVKKDERIVKQIELCAFAGVRCPSDGYVVKMEAPGIVFIHFLTDDDLDRIIEMKTGETIECDGLEQFEQK